MIQEFNKFVNNYDLSDEKIMYKVEHSVRVMEKNKEYARKLGFSKDEIKLAEQIGLLHDVGRFKQLEVTDSFVDYNGFDHAEYGVQYLFTEGNISKFIKDKTNYDIIKFAIKNHNKYKLPRCSDVQTLKQAKLIRDTDKIDILNLVGNLKEYNLKCDDSKISEPIMSAIKKHKLVFSEDIKTHNDDLAAKFALGFDINNDLCLKEIRKNIDGYYKQIEDNGTFKEIYEEVIKYLDERIDKYVRN